MLEDMLAFAIVVEQSSMNKASVQLNMSQPALSRRISKLEEELGVELFRRIGKRLELTRVGQLTYEYALELRTLHQRYLHTVSGFRSEGVSEVTIGASLTTLQTTLPDFIRLMNEERPDLDIKAVTGKTHEIVSLVRERKVDFGIVASRIQDPQLHCVPLFDDHLVLVAPRNQIVTDRWPLTIEQMNGLPIILFTKGTWYRTLTDEVFEKYKLEPDVRMEIDSFEAILRLLVTCRAATLLPQSYVRPQMLDANELTIVPVRELAETKRTTSVIYAAPSGLSSAVRLWIDNLAATYPTRI
ncbi:DNA-binding transcriptional LysR family regulator [Paenibacillus cellulosilyticus]|uniref:DNA-binding transcriptional LysR family regulator n=1 Tax=Paenibacillus cellulosilyticus TaxID=375489 RepID=A0A2V2Y9Q6_9BACL|nr:LysR family transcriptional regulator [Paenibacillus cellulosilyticus]PWV87847.1 DNA-binding transcriptional LysR family regulator [Paenibacillus cellulosilyticus]QKS47010.1 LysR family transcriptional regulator [Paenibacillus cellulosilyticus]